MRIWSRLSNWLRRKRRRAFTDRLGMHREFVYLDEIAVYSILASHKTGIATEFSESETASLNSEVKSSVGVGLGGTKANLTGKMQAGQVESTQVLRKAIIQTSFKELYDAERKSNGLRLDCNGDPPQLQSPCDLEELLDDHEVGDWVVDPRTLRRGEILEVEVELEADPIFRMATIITTFFELMEDNEQLFENAVTAQVPEMRSVASLLDTLLAGLVPIRGHLVDYDWARIGGRDVLVHHSLLCQLPTDTQPETHPVFLVGVAQRDLFWKDIRRVLFSQSRYTVFCRLATGGLASRWTPVKMADVFSSIAPDFDGLIQGLSDELITGFKQGVHSATSETSPTVLDRSAQNREHLLRNYLESLAVHHSVNLEPAVADGIIHGISGPEDFPGTVAENRPVFREVTDRFDDMFNIKTPVELAPDLRLQAIRRSNPESVLEPEGSTVPSAPPEPRCERYLDSEIIAIYW